MAMNCSFSKNEKRKYVENKRYCSSLTDIFDFYRRVSAWIIHSGSAEYAEPNIFNKQSDCQAWRCGSGALWRIIWRIIFGG